MATAPAHKLGQMIGDFIEKYSVRLLQEICDERNLYLDMVGRERTARKGKKVSWYDSHGNKHDLDFVIERNGSDTEIGSLSAVIECAWRRYTKHSKNKAQEIQGAVLPIADKHKNEKPFLGAIIAGLFTQPSIDQLNSCGFKTIYLKYDDIVRAFNTIDIDMSFDENTPTDDAEQKVELLEGLTDENYLSVFEKIVEYSHTEIESFKTELTNALDRQIDRVIITPLFGNSTEFGSITDAMYFLDDFTKIVANSSEPLKKIDVSVRYSNGDTIHGNFTDKENTLRFLSALSI